MSVVWETGRPSKFYSLPSAGGLDKRGLQRSLPTSVTDSVVPLHVQWQEQVRKLNAAFPVLYGCCHSLLAHCLQKRAHPPCALFFLCLRELPSPLSALARDQLILLTCMLVTAKFCFDKLLFWSWQMQKVVFSAWFRLELFWSWWGSLCQTVRDHH